MSDLKPTDEQVAILDAATKSDDNLMVNALAGTGKTSTIMLVERAVKTKPVLYLVFNTRNAKEAEKKMLSTTTVRTANGMGHRVWGKTIGKNLSLDPKKCQDILRNMIKSVKDKNTVNQMWTVYWDVIQGVAMAKALGYKPPHVMEQIPSLCEQGTLHAALDERPDDLVSDLIDAVLHKSILTAYEGLIDYNDQIYMPAVFGGIFPQFPLVMVDEYQDMNPANHRLIERLCKKSRLMGVGDPYQSIYAFRGAKTDGMQVAQAQYKMRSLPLSISFRCPQAIVEAARWRVPHFNWIKPGGYVEELQRLPAASISDGCTFLCRNNAPLFRVAMQLLTIGRSVSVAGSDIGPRIIGIMRKLGSDDYPRSRVLEAIAEWQADREAKESKTAADLADCMRVFARHGNTLSSAISYAEHLFKQEGTIRLSTGHKAKGMEWDTVYHLDPWLCGEDEQDLNLKYVIQTRAMQSAYEIDAARIEWQ